VDSGVCEVKSLSLGILPAPHRTEVPHGRDLLGQRDLRDLTRYRTKLVQEHTREVNRVQGVLERANIKLASVATDIMGVSGRAILQALIVGRADPATMAALAKGRLRSKLPLLEQALRGLVRDHHRRLLALQLAHIDFLAEQIEAFSTEITRCLTDLSPEDAPAQPAAPTEVVESQPELSPPGTPLTFTRAIALLDTIPGIDRRVAETGIDMARFGTAARLAARRGRKRAIVAVAHSRVVSAFHMLSRQEPYQELEAHDFDEQQRHHLVDRLTRRIE
jgi:transposase